MPSGRAGVAGPLAAFVVLGVIGWLAADVFPRVRVEARLRRAAALIAENPILGLEFLDQETSAEGLSARQRERGAELARDAIARICCGRPMLRMIGGHAYDPAGRPHPYVTASRGMMLVFELPPGIEDLGWRIRVSEGPRELCEVLSMDGRQARGEVPLPMAGTVIVDVDVVCCVGVYGTVTFPIAHGLRLVQKTRGPSVILRAGSTVRDLKDGEPALLQVERGTPLRIELKDELGLSELQWSVDGVAYDPFDWLEDAEAQARVAALPADLTAHAAHGRALELKASNSIGLTTRAVVRLFVRDSVAPPIAHARIHKAAIQDGSTVRAGEKAMTLRVEMTPGEVPEELVVSWDDQPQKCHVSGTQVAALLEADAEGTKVLVLAIRKAPVLRCAVQFDWTPPAVNVVLDPGRQGRELEFYRPHDVPIGAIVSIAATDLAGIDREATEWTIDREALEETSDPEPAPVPGSEAARMWTRCFRCARPGETRVSVAATDTAGNRSTIHEYRLRVADPMAGRTVTLNGHPFPAGATIWSNEVRFDVKTEGGIDLDGLVFSLLDPEQRHAPLGHVSLERAELAGIRTGTLDASFLATSARRIVGVLSQNDRELSKGTIIVDFVRPSFRVLNVEDAGVLEGVPRFYGAAGQGISLTITDDVGVDMSTISALQGADIAHVSKEGSGAGVVLLLPAVIEEPVVVEVADVAGNRASFRFEIVTRPDPESRPDSQPDSPAADPPTPPPAEQLPRLEDLLATPKIVHPLLGTYLLVPVKDPRVASFYAGERELTVKNWRDYVNQLQAQPHSTGLQAARQQALATEASRLLLRNTKKLSKDDDDPLAGATAELVKAYAGWANVVAPEYGTWRVPTVNQWILAAGRASYPDAVYPTTQAFPNGGDLTNEGMGGALFGRDFLAVQEMPRRALGPGAFNLRGMPGSLFEWVVDAQGTYRLIGGSAVSPKEACRLDAPLRSGIEVADYERGLRLVLMPKAR